MAEIKILKLISGEEIIGEVLENGSEICIKNPVRIVVMPGKDPREPQVGLAPWGQFSKEKTFSLHKAHIVVIMTPIDAFVNQHKEMFGGIVIPKQGLILPE